MSLVVINSHEAPGVAARIDARASSGATFPNAILEIDADETAWLALRSYDR